MKPTMKTLAASLLVAFAPLVAAQTSGDIDTQVRALDKTGANRGQALVASKIAGNFTTLAGSEANALALANALRTGEPVTLTYAPTGTATTPTTSTIDPPTGHMGWGNVKISLALAQDQLARLGVTNPTAEQLQAALNGGSVTVRNADGTSTTTTLRGVLQMRADGMGWGNIAKAGGTKVGPVVSQLKMANTRVAAIPPTTAAGTSATTTASAKSKAVTTAAGAQASAPKRGITTATGSTDASAGKHGLKGITTATGTASPSASRGLTTAEGAVSAPRGNASGRGVVTAAGGGATNSAAAFGRHSGGAGLVTGSGGNAATVSTAQGNAGGNGKGQGGDHGGGKGKGGG